MRSLPSGGGPRIPREALRERAPDLGDPRLEPAPGPEDDHDTRLRRRWRPGGRRLRRAPAPAGAPRPWRARRGGRASRVGAGSPRRGGADHVPDEGRGDLARRRVPAARALGADDGANDEDAVPVGVARPERRGVARGVDGVEPGARGAFVRRLGVCRRASGPSYSRARNDLARRLPSVEARRRAGSSAGKRVSKPSSASFSRSNQPRLPPRRTARRGSSRAGGRPTGGPPRAARSRASRSVRTTSASGAPERFRAAATRTRRGAAARPRARRRGAARASRRALRERAWRRRSTTRRPTATRPRRRKKTQRGRKAHHQS